MVLQLGRSWLDIVTTYPKWVLGCVLCALVVAGVGLPKLKIDASADSLTLENDADLNYFRQVIESYNSGDFLVVTYHPNTPLFSESSLTVLAQLQHDLQYVRGVAEVNSILNVPLLYSPKRSLREMTKEPRTLLTPDVDRALAKQEFLTSPIYKNLILSPDGETTALQLNLEVDQKYIDLVQRRDALRGKRRTDGLTESEQIELVQVTQEFLAYRTEVDRQAHQRVRDIRRIVKKYESDAEIFIGGVQMITADMVAFIKKDLEIFGSAAILFMVVVLAFIFRSFRFVVIPMATCLTAVFLMLGLLAWTDWRLTVISSNFVALLLIVSLAIIIHLVVRYREYEQEYPDWPQEKLVKETVKFMAKPCLYTALTTIVAFASLVVSDIRPVIDFGWMMTIGLIFALSLAFILLPASLMLTPREEADELQQNSGVHVGEAVTGSCARFVENHGSLVFVGSVIVAILSVVGLMRLEVENRFVDYFHEDTEIHQGLSVIDQRLGGTTSLDIIISAKASGVVFSADDLPVEYTDEDDPFAEADPFDESDPFADVNPVSEEDPFAEADPFSEHGDAKNSVWMTVAGLQQVEEIHDYLESLPEIGKVFSLATLYKVGGDINGSLNNFELALMEKSLSPEVRDFLISPYLNYDADETRITMRIKDTYPGLERAELVKRIRHHLDAMPELNTEHVHFSGLLVLYNNMLQSLFSSQIVTLGVVFIGIGLMFWVLFKSLIVAVVALTPNILAALSIIGGMGLAGIPLDMMTITIAAITVGIGVDDTIHYIHRMKTELEKDGDYIAAMHRSHISIGRAMYYTSIIIIFGFSIMVFSEFIPTIYFGLLTGLAMLAALMGALLLLPKLIVLIKPFGQYDPV